VVASIFECGWCWWWTERARAEKEKFAKCVDQKISQMEKDREEENKESRDITGIIKRQEHQAREKE